VQSKKFKPIHQLMIRWLYWVANCRGQMMEFWLNANLNSNSSSSTWITKANLKVSELEKWYQKERERYLSKH
jgi:hypothetical protein